MKKIFIAIVAIVSSGIVYGQSTDGNAQMQEISEKVSVLETSVHSLDSMISNQASLIQNLQKVVAGVGQQQTSTKQDVDNLKAGQTSLGEQIALNAAEIKSTSDDLNSQMASTNYNVKAGLDNTASKIKSQGLVFGIIIALLFAVALLSYLLLRKRIQSSVTSIDEVKKAQDKLQQESLGLDEKLMEVLNKKMTIEKEQSPTNAKPDHSLAIKVADEIVRIETNLSRMDPSVKGYKQLSASLRRIKDNFASNGYEIVDMLGKPYTDGMKAIVNYVSDDSLEEGAQIITGIIKPQINFNGEMIQSAQITVSQN